MANLSTRERLNPYLVLSATGVIDLDASVAKFKRTCVEYIAEQYEGDSLIKTALTSLFDEYRGKFITADAIGSMTITRMAQVHPKLGEPGAYIALCKRINQVIHEDLGEGKTYIVKRGAGKGFARASDQPVNSDDTGV